MEITVVVFRKWKSKPYTILALFPEISADKLGFACQSYEHIGQHGAAEYYSCVQRTVPAEPAEYAELKAELEKLGYVLMTRKRIACGYHWARQNLR